MVNLITSNFELKRSSAYFILSQNSIQSVLPKSYKKPNSDFCSRVCIKMNIMFILLLEGLPIYVQYQQ